MGGLRGWWFQPSLMQIHERPLVISAKLVTVGQPLEGEG